jgi:nucleoside-diphosphate-sugar epimerase
MNKTYLITGGTGFMGSQLAKKILESGNRVIFVGRQKRGENYQNRIREQYKSYDANLTETLEVDLEVIDSNDLINKIVSISSKLDGIWHLAANLSFKDSDRNQVFAANKNSTSTIIKVAKKFNTTLYHTSTAYVHGRGSGTSMEEFNLKPKYFNNPYEESKYEAEQLIKNSTDLKYVIFRPSILYDRHGEYITNFGYYSFLIALFKFKKSLNLKMGTAIFFPLPFLYYKKSYLNLMPLDVAINWMYEISEDEKSVGLIFHICNPSPFLIRDIFKQTFKVFNLIMPIVGVPKTLAYIYFTLINVTAKIITPLKPIALRIHHFKWYLLEHVYYNMSNTRNFIKNDIDTHFLASKDHIFEVASAVVCKLELYKKK